ncbi:MAG: hypothetical protein IT562_06360 [Alphaproteobacteria bacterium]|nr:hypothetical protein [Alphaproteobacteria bacterium]
MIGELSRLGRVEIAKGGTGSRVAALALLGLALLALLLVLVLPLGALRARLAEDIAGYQGVLAIEGEIARRQVELRDAAKSLGDPGALNDLLLAGNSDAIALAGLHERTRELIAAARASLISIQQLPPGDEGGHRRIALRVQFAADLPGFQRIAYALESGRPAVIVTNLYVRARSARAAGVVNPLDIQMDLIAYRKEGAS